ncbi:MAG: hypothetical protein ACK5RL_09330 [Acidimicrobiales bacterium]
MLVRGRSQPAGMSEIAVVGSSVAGADLVVPLVTGLPLGVGDSVANGLVVAEVAERPVFVFEGSLPAFRSLRVGTRGDDVAQLEAALGSLGLLGATPDDTLDPMTATTVAEMYRRAGYDPPADGTVLPLSEFAFIDGLPREVDSVLLARGDLVDGPILRVATDQVEVTAEIPGADRRLLATGMAAVINFDDLALTVDATLTVLGDQPIDGSGGLYTVVFSPLAADEVSGVTDAPARVVVPLESSDGEVLVVPVAALTAGPDGSTRVEVLGDDGSLTDIPVTTGLTAGGEVAVTPADTFTLVEGDRVVVG